MDLGAHFFVAMEEDNLLITSNQPGRKILVACSSRKPLIQRKESKASIVLEVFILGHWLRLKKENNVEGFGY